MHDRDSGKFRLFGKIGFDAVSRRRYLRGAASILAAYTLLWFVYHMIRRDSFFPYPSLHDGLLSYIYNFTPTFVLAFCDYVIIFLLLERVHAVSRRLPLKIAADIVVSLGTMVVFVWLFLAVNRLFDPTISFDQAGIFMYNILIVLCLEILYLHRRSRNALAKAELAKREALQYKFYAFKAQIDPHFLFNSLNILLGIIPEDSRKATDFTRHLSRIYRYTLMSYNRSTVALSEEMQFLKSYIRVLEIRCGSWFSVEIIERQSVRDPNIVPFTLQLLVENITKHNRISEQHPMHVLIEVGCDSLTVTNPIMRRGDSVARSGVGLNYLRQQYAAAGRLFEVVDDGRVFIAKVPYL